MTKDWREVARRVRSNNVLRMAFDSGFRYEESMEKIEREDYDRMERFYWLALAGEVGEGCNLAKKRWRDGPRWTPAQAIENLAAIREELCDVRIYVEALADLYGMDLDAECAKKLERVSARPFAQPVKP